MAEEQRGVGDVAGQRAGLVERRGEGDHPVAADGAVGRLQPDDPAQRRRLADRAAGVRADRPRREAGRDGGGAAAARAARDARAVPRVEHRPVGRVLVRRAHRELVLVGLAQQRRPGSRQALHDGGRVGRPVALEDPRPGLARHALGAEQVLDRERHPAERALRPAPPARRRRPRVKALSSSAAPAAVGLEELEGASSPAATASTACAAVSAGRGRSCRPAGSGPGSRRRRPRARWPSTTSRGSHGRGSSARSACRPRPRASW